MRWSYKLPFCAVKAVPNANDTAGASDDHKRTSTADGRTRNTTLVRQSAREAAGTSRNRKHGDPQVNTRQPQRRERPSTVARSPSRVGGRKRHGLERERQLTLTQEERKRKGMSYQEQAKRRKAKQKQTQQLRAKVRAEAKDKTAEGQASAEGEARGGPRLLPFTINNVSSSIASSVSVPSVCSRRQEADRSQSSPLSRNDRQRPQPPQSGSDAALPPDERARKRQKQRKRMRRIIVDETDDEEYDY